MPVMSPSPSQMKHRGCTLFPDFPGRRGQTPVPAAGPALCLHCARVACPLAGEGAVVIGAPSPSGLVSQEGRAHPRNE